MELYLPVTKGSQGGHTIYCAMVSYAELSQCFIFDDEDLPVELRQQRDINEKRADSFFKYMEENEQSYVSGSLTGTYNKEVEFIPLDNPFASDKLGLLKIPSTSRICLCDGQHRQAGIAAYFDAHPDQGHQCIPVKLYFADTVERKQQIFADINGHTVKPSASLAITFDHRTAMNTFVKELLEELPHIKSKVDMSNASVGSKSQKLWPVVSFKRTLCHLLGLSEKQFAEEVDSNQVREQIKQICVNFFNGLAYVPYYQSMIDGKLDLVEARQEKVVSHAVFLEALGVYGNALLLTFDDNGAEDWGMMANLKNIDVTKMNSDWRGRCVNINGTMNKSAFGVKSTAAMICSKANIPLTDDLQKFEQRVTESLNP